MRVCLDTNVLVAALATRGLCTDVLRTVLAEHDLVIGDVIVAELRRVLRAKLKVPADRLDAIDAVFAPCPVIPKPEQPGTSAIRDAADRWIVATAVAGCFTGACRRSLLSRGGRLHSAHLRSRKEYDFSSAKPNPYAKRLKQSVTIRLDTATIDYFERLAEELDVPYQTLINLYLRDCAATGRRPAVRWRPAKSGAA